MGKALWEGYRSQHSLKTLPTQKAQRLTLGCLECVAKLHSFVKLGT